MKRLIPELSRQIKIVAILDNVTEIINKRKQQMLELDTLIKARFVERFGDVEKEKYCKLEDICSIITDGTHQPPKFIKNGIPFILVSNLANDEITYETEKYISEDTYKALVKRTPIEIGDVLISAVGSYGHIAIVKSEKRFLFQRHIAYMKPNQILINSEYLRGALLSSDGQRQMDESVKGIAQKTLNLSEIRNITIPLVSMERQRDYAAFVTQVDKSKFEIQKSLEKTQLLFDSLMQQYFG